MKVNLSSYGTGRRKKWIINLQQQFAETHDIKLGNILISYISTPNGAKAFSTWLKNEGFDANFWCIEPLITYNDDLKKEIKYIGFGIDFSDSCPKLIEAMLRS